MMLLRWNLKITLKDSTNNNKISFFSVHIIFIELECVVNASFIIVTQRYLNAEFVHFQEVNTFLMHLC